MYAGKYCGTQSLTKMHNQIKKDLENHVLHTFERNLIVKAEFKV